MHNDDRPSFHYTSAEELYQRLPASSQTRLNDFSRLTGVSYGSVYYPYLVCCEYYLYLLTTTLNSFPSGQQIDTLLEFLKNYEKNISALGERVEESMKGVIDASNPNGVARYLALICTVTGIVSFAAGAAFVNWTQTNTQLKTIANTSALAMRVYYLNQNAISNCQRRFRSKFGVITCPSRLIVPSK